VQHLERARLSESVVSAKQGIVETDAGSSRNAGPDPELA
jgi:hypothetical protein